MPPRYAYWTIIVDDQATAFRAGSLEDIMPTFNRLKEKQPSAKLLWFQGGKLWPSRVDAREAMQMRGERGRDRDPRQARQVRPAGGNRGGDSGKPAWKPKSDMGSATSRSEKPIRLEWKPRSEGAPGSSGSAKPGRLEWRPKASSGHAASGREAQEGKRKWVPKAEYKKLTGTEAPRDKKWRPGGEHVDPRQKYKDAKKAKWTRVKHTIRARAQKPRGKGDK